MKIKKILNSKSRLPVIFLLLLIFIGGFYYYLSQFSNQGLSKIDPVPVEKRERSSFHPEDSRRAVLLVKNLPEVQEWLNLFSNPDGTAPSTGGKPIIELDSEQKGIYTIHVYESLTDHNTTFNWFYVDVKTENIKDFFGKEY